MGINANGSPNVGANMVMSSLGLTVSNYYEDGFFVQLFENKFKLSMRHDQKPNIQYEHKICQPNQQPPLDSEILGKIMANSNVLISFDRSK